MMLLNWLTGSSRTFSYASLLYMQIGLTRPWLLPLSESKVANLKKITSDYLENSVMLYRANQFFAGALTTK